MIAGVWIHDRMTFRHTNTLFDDGSIMDLGNPFEELQKAGAAVQNLVGTAVNAAGEAATQVGEVAGSIASQAGEAASEAASQIGEMASDTGKTISGTIASIKQDVERQHAMNFQSIEALQPVVNVVNEAAAALDDKARTTRESAIPEVLGGALGATAGGIASFAALYGLGTVGLSAAGMTSALATAGAIVGGGMAAGVFVLAAPVAIGAGVGVGLAAKLRADQLRQEKERLYEEALKKHQAIIRALMEEVDATKERIDYLQSLNILLAKAIEELREDLGKQ